MWKWMLAFCLALCGCANQPAQEVPEAQIMPEEQTEAKEEIRESVPSKNGQLKVEDGKLVSETGEPVLLKGVSSHGLAWFPEYVNEDKISELKTLGANVFRLALYTSESGGWCTDGNREALMEVLDRGVKLTTNHDMYVIVDWHVLQDQDPMVYKEEAVDFFSTVSEKYADHNNVLYEICNEPNGAGTWDRVKEFSQSVIPAIRENTDAVILIGTPTWSQDLEQPLYDPVAGDNLMYSLHFYAATHQQDLRSRVEQVLEAGLPVFVTEFGISEASGNGRLDEESADTWMELLDKYNVSRILWNLSNKEESSALMNPDGTWSESGQYMKRMLKGEETVQEKSENKEENKEEKKDNGLSIQNSWESNGHQFVQYSLDFSAGPDWTYTITGTEGATISDSWNGTFSLEGNTLTITPVDWNKGGGTLSDIGFILEWEGKPGQLTGN